MLKDLFLEGFRMPGEWEKQKSVWIVWPYNKKDWPGLLDKIPEVEAEHESTKYQRTRAVAYPSIGDQLDALYHSYVDPGNIPPGCFVPENYKLKDVLK